MTWKIKLNGTFFVTMVFIVVALFFSVMLLSNNPDYNDVFNAHEGILELAASDFEYTFPLRGEWKYYDQQLITETNDSSDYEIVTVPHSWNQTGFGTYTLTIKGLIPNQCYSLYLYDTTSAYSLYINSNLIATNGQVGTNYETEKLHWEPQVKDFTSNISTAELIIQVSNFHMYPGGLIRDITLGTPEHVHADQSRNISYQMILLGGILIMAFYNLSLYLLNTKDRAALYFSLFNFTVSARIIITGERLINTWIDHPNWEFLMKSQFVIGSAMLGFFVLFMYSLFKDKMHLIIVQSTLSFTILLSLSAFGFKQTGWFAYMDIVFLAVSALFFVYMISVLIHSIKRKITGSVFSFIGLVFILGTIILDTVLPAGSNILSIGTFIFIIFHSLVTAEKYTYLAEQNKILHHVATRDDMTNLYKKEHFRKLVTGILEEDTTSEHHALMFIDVDQFKDINDTYGHDIGDEMIVTIAGKLIRSLRYSDIASRFGGDEFIVWLHNTKKEEAKVIAQRVLEHIASPLLVHEHEISVTVSIGISFYPEDGVDLESLLPICDQRMYHAKSLGKNQYSSEI